MKFYRIEQPKHLREYFLFEAAINIDKLLRPVTKGPYAGLYGADIILQCIQDKTPITLTDGRAVVMDETNTSQHVLSILQQFVNATHGLDQSELDGVVAQYKAAFKTALKGKPFAGVDSNNQPAQFGISDILKTSTFGGESSIATDDDSSAAAGGKKAAIQETGQALFLAAATEIDISDEDIKTPDGVRKILQTGASKTNPAPSPQMIDDITTLIQNDASWGHTFITTVRALQGGVEHLGKLDFKGKVFYRDKGGIVNLIKSAFTRANKTTNVDDTSPQQFGEINKWNPSDIWMVAPGIEKDKSIKTIQDFQQLNQWMLNAFKQQTVVGISLKKLGKDSHVTVNNFKPHDALIQNTLTGLVLNKKISSKGSLANIFDSKDTYVKYESHAPLSMYVNLVEGGEVQFRTSEDKVGAIRGEISGSSARHGNVVLKYINKFLTDSLGSGAALTPYGEIQSMGRLQMIDTIVRYSMEILGDTSQVTPDIISHTVDKASRGVSLAKLVSKYQAVELLYKLHKAPNKAAVNKFLTDLIQYAGAVTADSSVYVKVS